jgi:tRNA dimethylallyltransferase
VIRAEVAGDLATKGASVLREELAVCDPESAARIHANDLYRLTRALEILRATGRPLASFLPKKVDREASPPPWLIIHYRRPRDELRARIAARVDAMLAEGLAEEVSALRRAGHGPEEPGMKAIGYAEFFTLEAEGLSGSALLAAARDRITTNSIHYAKRQETFFRSLPGAVILEAGPCASDDFATLLGPCLKDLSS